MTKATIKQVAAEAGVSTATVSRVLTGSGYVSDEIKRRVQGAVDKLNYKPNAIARSLKQDKTHTIGVVVPDISNSFFMSIARGVEDIVQPKGYHLIFCSSDENPVKEGELLQLLHEKRVDAVVLATSGRNEPLIGKLSRSGLPVILLDRRVDDPELQLDLVAEDNVAGAYRLTKRLLEQGHKRIGVINGSAEASTGRDRHAGCMQAIREAGLPEEPRLVYDGQFSAEGGMRAVRHFMRLEEKPTAIVSFNNKMSFGALQELTRLGLRVPRDMAVASYGEVEAALLLKEPGLLFVKQTPYEMGRCTGELLLTRLVGGERRTCPRQMIFTPEVNLL